MKSIQHDIYSIQEVAEVNSVHIHDPVSLSDVYLENVTEANQYFRDNSYYIDKAFIDGEVLSVLVV